MATQLTQKDALNAIRWLGFHARVRDGEYRVTYGRTNDEREDNAYYTDDPQDALDTARHMAKEREAAFR